jgi:predicted phage terminase large subunit-like protein
MTSSSSRISFEHRKASLEDDMWRLSLSSFAMMASHWRFRWKNWNYVRLISDTIEQAIQDGNGRIIINAPPRHGKSEIVSHWLPVWFLDLYPERRVISTCYGDSLAAEWGRMARDEFLMNPKCLTKLRDDAQSATDWRTLEGGGMRTAGTGGPITGTGADLCIIDDPHKNWEDARSVASRSRLINWFNSTLYPRLEPGGTIVVVHTRWVQRDLTGYLLEENEDDWTHIHLPAIAEDGDLLGRKPGEALCPDRFPEDRLEKIRQSIGPMMFAGLYQQRPAPMEGGMLKRVQINYWKTIPTDLIDIILSWDLTFTGTGTSFFVGQVWARSTEFPARRYLIDQVRDRGDFIQQIAEMRKMIARWPDATALVVEEAANGAAAIATLKREIAKPPIIAVKPRSSKEVRLSAILPEFEAGNVFVPDPTVYAWARDWVEEMVIFPNGENDDQVDTSTMALARYRETIRNQEPIRLNLSIGRKPGVPGL